MQSYLNCVGKLFVVLFLFGRLTFGQSEVTKVEPGHTLERELKGGEKNVFVVDAAADQFLHLTVMQNGIDVAVGLIAPDGTKLMEVDSPNGESGPEPLWFVAAKAGNYAVEVTFSADKAAAPGKFEISMDEPRLATTDDRRFVRGETAIQAGLALGDPEDPAVRPKALEKYTEAARSFDQIDSNKELKAEGYAEAAQYLGTVGSKDLARHYYDESAAVYLSLGKKPEAIAARWQPGIHSINA